MLRKKSPYLKNQNLVFGNYKLKKLDIKERKRKTLLFPGDIK